MSCYVIQRYVSSLPPFFFLDKKETKNQCLTAISFSMPLRISSIGYRALRLALVANA